MDKSNAAADMFNKMARLYEARYMNVDSYAESLNLFCNRLTRENASILELACGPGNLTKYLLSRNPKLKILATDLAPNMIELARINCPAASFQIMDCRKLSVLTGTYDAIIVGFCLPYLAKEDFLELIRSVKNLLSPGGIFYLSTMEGDYNNSKIQKSSSGDEVFVYYYDRQFIEGALQSEGFKIINMWSQPDLTQKEETTDLIFLAHL